MLDHADCFFEHAKEWEVFHLLELEQHNKASKWCHYKVNRHAIGLELVFHDFEEEHKNILELIVFFFLIQTKWNYTFEEFLKCYEIDAALRHSITTFLVFIDKTAAELEYIIESIFELLVCFLIYVFFINAFAIWTYQFFRLTCL